MKRAIGSIAVDSEKFSRMTIYYNGKGEPLTAEAGDKIDVLEYLPTSLTDARIAARAMYILREWDYKPMY